MKNLEEQRAEKHREGSRKYYQENRGKRIKATQDWRKDNIDKVNAYARLNRQRTRRACLAHYSQGKLICACCGEKHIEFLGIDHINNDGAQERKRLGHGNIHQHLKNLGYPDGYRVLCHNCNMSRGFYGYCPHK